MKRSIGIIGGMGPLATAELFRMIIENTDSATDQGHIRIFIDNNTQIPDRTKAILCGGPSPVPEMISSAKKLECMGADFLIMPCNTAHFFIDEVQAHCGIGIINMIEETAKVLTQRKIRKAGLLATSGTILGGVYRKFFEPYDIELICPDEQGQEAVMQFIYNGVKAGNAGFDTAGFRAAAGRVLDKGAQTLILGCTELPVGLKMYQLDLPCTDALEVLALEAVRKAGYQLRKTPGQDPVFPD